MRRQLCLALIALTVHVPAGAWEGGEPVLWLSSRIQIQAPDVALPCLLELLTLMPQVRVCESAWVCACVCACVYVHAGAAHAHAPGMHV